MTATLAILAGCSSDVSDLDPTPKALTCSTDDDCPEDSHCKDMECTLGSGNECEADADCETNQYCKVITDCGATRCHGNTCEPKVECTFSSDCPEGQLCSDFVCIDAPACQSDADCPDDSFCNDEMQCEARGPEKCEEDTDCPNPTDICQDGECTERISCKDSSDCPSDLRCQSGVCRNPCQSDDDCGGPRFTCNMNGECLARCFNDQTCESGFICEDNVCLPQECESNEDCDATASEECVGIEEGHGRCEFVQRCMDDSECPDNFSCEETRCRELPRCLGDRDCGPDRYCDDGHCQKSTTCTVGSCPAGEICIADRCVPDICRSIDDCDTAGEICISGQCQVPPPPSFVTEIRIVTPSGVVRPQGTYQFTAIALNQAGNVVPGVSFDWTSTSTLVATIDANGLATGQNRAGETQIIARASTGVMSLSSTPVTLINLGALSMTTQLRVTVVDISSGGVLSGVPLTINDGTQTFDVTTDAQGKVSLSSSQTTANTFTVTAWSPSHNYTTIDGITSNDIVLPLRTLTSPQRAGGLKGAIDLSMVNTSGDLAYSISGASFPTPLFTYDPGDLFGRDVHQIDVMNFKIPVGASATLSATVFGMSFNLKDTYYTQAAQGQRAAWSFGGRVDFDFLGGFASDNLLASILPRFQQFDHDVRPSIRVVSVPKVTDTADIDNDEDTSELVPDFANFPDVGLTPKVEQTLRYALETDNVRLPFVTGGNADTLLIVTGSLLPGIGFVPLGLDGLTDDSGNGVVPSFTAKLAPPHSGLEQGQFAVLATAFRNDNNPIPQPGSTRIFVGSSLPRSVDFRSGWIDAPLGAEFDRGARNLSVSAPTGSDLLHFTIQHSEGAWDYYTAPFTQPKPLPAIPMGTTDRTQSATISVSAIDLAASSNVSSLFDVSNGGVGSLDRVTERVSKAKVSIR